VAVGAVECGAFAVGVAGGGSVTLTVAVAANGVGVGALQAARPSRINNAKILESGANLGMGKIINDPAVETTQWVVS
jgi:hypothetical protein